MFKSVRRKLNTLMDDFGKNMNGIWILNNKLVDQEDCSRRNNLRIDDIKKKDGES